MKRKQGDQKVKEVRMKKGGQKREHLEKEKEQRKKKDEVARKTRQESTCAALQTCVHLHEMIISSAEQ